MKYFTIEKQVSLRAYLITILPPTDLSDDEKTHYIFLLAGALWALKWRHPLKYFRIERNDHIFYNIGMAYPFQIDLALPINKDPYLLDEFAQEAISWAEAIIDKEKERENKKQLALSNLREEKSAWLERDKD